MAQTDTGRKSKLRRESEANPTETSAIPVTPTPQPTPQVQQPPPIAPEIKDELTSLMQNLILKANELSFEYSTLECDEITNCPLAKKSKELFKELKKLTEFVRKMAQPPVGYVR